MSERPYIGKSHQIEESACPECGYVADGISGCGNEAVAPKPGDVSLCINCACLSVFDTDLSRRKPTVDEVFEFNKDPRIRPYLEALKKVKRRMG